MTEQGKIDRRTLKLSYPNKAELQAEICERLAADESMAAICRAQHMPSTATVYNWIFTDPKFASNIRLARMLQAEAAADQLGEIRRKLEEGSIDVATATAAGNLLKWEVSKRTSRFLSPGNDDDRNQEAQQQYDFSRISFAELEVLEGLLAKCSITSDRAGAPGPSEPAVVREGNK